MNNWPYAELSHVVKEAGGREAYEKMLKLRGFKGGVIAMLPLCITGCVITYKKGTQIVHFVKDKLGIITKEDVQYAAKQLDELEKCPVIECSECGRKAYGIDEINTIFGFTKNDSGELVPNNCCKQCNGSI